MAIRYKSIRIGWQRLIVNIACLANRYSTDTEGLAACLGLQVSPRVELQAIIAKLERKLSHKTLFTIGT